MIDRDLTQPLALVQNKDFWHDGGVTFANELTCITCIPPVQDALAALEAASGPYALAYKLWEAHADACKEGNGLIVDSLIPKWVKDGHSRAEKAYHDALHVLDNTLSAVVVDCVFDALALAGVSDQARMERIARTVVQGGPELPLLPARGDSDPKRSDPLTCPHCGQEVASGGGETAPDKGRCIHCERRIG